MHLFALQIENFRGIKSLSLRFLPDVNVLIGPNGSRKTAVLDAIRLFYSNGQEDRDIFVRKSDFYVDSSGVRSEKISLTYYFAGLDASQEGALYEYLWLSGSNKLYARYTMEFTIDAEDRIRRTAYSGGHPSTRPSSQSFELFHHYHLEAYRDCTRDTFVRKGSIVAKLLKSFVGLSGEASLTNVFVTANNDILQNGEVRLAIDSINNNVISILPRSQDNLVAARIDDQDADSILNSLKLYLPLDKTAMSGSGFSLSQNSLGYNNLLYIATVLGDISKRTSTDDPSHFALIIEEPEAHLHPQLQLNLYKFLNGCRSQNSQLFLSTHSPTLTSTIPLDHITLLDTNRALRVSSVFKQRESDGLMDSTETLNASQCTFRKRQLERYLDVTRSQLLFARAVLLVEGISEALLLPVFAKLLNKSLVDSEVELVNVDGTSFAPFLYLFNSPDKVKRFSQKVAVISDGDHFPQAGKSAFSYTKLTENPTLIDDARRGIREGQECTRIVNLRALAPDATTDVRIHASPQTLEYALIDANVPSAVESLKRNEVWNFLSTYKATSARIAEIETYVDARGTELSIDDRERVVLLLWRAIPSKSEFAQDFSIYLTDHPDLRHFRVPAYIQEAISHCTD
jgi:putative ATP-dependent endonuclease of the OLD family